MSISLAFGLSNNNNGDGKRSLLATFRRPYGSSRSASSKGRQPLGAVLHSSHEPGELWQSFVHDDSTIKVMLVIIIILLLSSFLLSVCL